MGSSRIDFSAQFGGRDAAAAVLPHFKALKAAARGLRLEGFPFAKLAFILRADGEIHRFGFSGLGGLEIDKDGEYLSIDVGIQNDDRDRLFGVIGSAILSAGERIRMAEETRSRDVDFQALQRCLTDLSDHYKNELAGQPAHARC